jgi:hypothetical protein
MEFITKITDQGIERTVDFQGAKSLNGVDIQKALNKNVSLKNEVQELRKELIKKSSILSKIIPWKLLRDFIEIALLIFGVVGIFTLLI